MEGLGAIPCREDGEIVLSFKSAAGETALHTIRPHDLVFAGNDYGFRRRITINHAWAGSNDSRDFPMLVSLRSTGRDVRFMDAEGRRELIHEIRSYDPDSGDIEAWVKIPSLSCTEDTVLYVYYGRKGAERSKPGEGTVWDENHKLILNPNKSFDGKNDCLTAPHSDDLNMRREITVEAWVNGADARADALQTIVGKWAPLTTFNTFDAYDATTTSGLDTGGFLGAVFDGRYVYFSPQHDTTGRHGKVLRFDTHGHFSNPKSWTAYDASATCGLVARGFYGAVFDGYYVYFVPRYDGKTFHTRVLRYNTHKAFDDDESWEAHDVGLGISYQGAGFDGRYVYFAPGTGNEGGQSGVVLRYDTHAPFNSDSGWVTFDANGTSGLQTKDFDGVAFDGRYVYFVPLAHRVVLSYDTEAEFTDKKSWRAFDAKPLKMRQCVGSVFDGQYLYFVPYDHHVVVRYDTRKAFEKTASWDSYDVKNTRGLRKWGYDGGFFDGRYVYFVPFFHTAGGGKMDFHCEVLRYDAAKAFQNRESWQTVNAGNTAGLKTVGYNAGAFDGRYFYFAPWQDGSTYPESIRGHGRVLRYDTLGNNGSFCLKYSDYGHNGGLCGAVPGPRFIVNTDQGVRSVAANRTLAPGWHYLAGVYDGRTIRLFVDGFLVGEQEATGEIVQNGVDVSIGRMLGGGGYFRGAINQVAVSDKAR
ncbi:DUF2341 domain-containing protein, partial [Verrucomicrobiota bacterium]